MVYIYINSVVVSEHNGLFRSPAGQVSLKHAEVFRYIVIKSEDFVTCAETHFLS